MIWHTNCHTIVMVVNLIENGKVGDLRIMQEGENLVIQFIDTVIHSILSK